MTKTGGALTLALAAILPLPAQAQDGDWLNCTALQTEPALQRDLGEALLADGAAMDPLLDRLATVIGDCAQVHGVPGEVGLIYFDHGFSSVLRAWLAHEMAAGGYPADAIDTALELGPQGRNPDLSEGISDAQVEAIIAVYSARGLDVNQAPPRVLEMIGAYAASSSSYWISLAMLTDYTLAAP